MSNTTHGIFYTVLLMMGVGYAHAADACAMVGLDAVKDRLM